MKTNIGSQNTRLFIISENLGLRNLMEFVSAVSSEKNTMIRSYFSAAVFPSFCMNSGAKTSFTSGRFGRQ
jgi:hypothetical protein